MRAAEKAGAIFRIKRPRLIRPGLAEENIRVGPTMNASVMGIWLLSLRMRSFNYHVINT